MTGKELYALYQAKLLIVQSCGSDNWDQMLENDQQVWDALATEISPPESLHPADRMAQRYAVRCAICGHGYGEHSAVYHLCPNPKETTGFSPTHEFTPKG